MLQLCALLVLTAPQERITTGSGVRVRAEAKKDGKELGRLGVGVIFTVLQEVPDGAAAWHKAKTQVGEGYMHSSLTQAFEREKRATIYRQIVDARMAVKDLPIEEGKDLVDFLARVVADVDKADQPAFEKDRLLALIRVLEKIPIEQHQGLDRWVKKFGDDAIYSDPAAMWMVRPVLLWTLRDKNKSAPWAEELAWQAVVAPHPGECEGAVPCYLGIILFDEAHFLNEYPKSAHADEALEKLKDTLGTIVESERYAADPDELKEIKESIAQIKKAVTKAGGAKAKPVIALLDKLGKIYAK